MTEFSPDLESNVSYKKAVAGAAEFADEIRDASRSQVEYWQQLPLLGLLSWGNAGVYTYEATTLYEKGVLGVNTSNDQYRLFGTYVDCESGDILYVRDDHFEARQPANDKQVIEAWLSQVPSKGIDASDVVSRYKAQVADQRRPKLNDMKLEEHLAILTPKRLALAKELGLRATTFRRDGSLQGVELDSATRDFITSVDPFYDVKR